MKTNRECFVSAFALGIRISVLLVPSFVTIRVIADPRNPKHTTFRVIADARDPQHNTQRFMSSLTQINPNMERFVSAFALGIGVSVALVPSVANTQRFVSSLTAHRQTGSVSCQRSHSASGFPWR